MFITFVKRNKTKSHPQGALFTYPILGHFFWTGSEEDYVHIPAKSTSLQRLWGGIIQPSANPHLAVLLHNSHAQQ